MSQGSSIEVGVINPPECRDTPSLIGPLFASDDTQKEVREGEVHPIPDQGDDVIGSGAAACTRGPF